MYDKKTAQKPDLIIIKANLDYYKICGACEAEARAMIHPHNFMP